jgi:stress response protein YsnF
MSSQGWHTVTAFFDTKEAASAAVEDLVQTGIPRSSVSLVSSTTSTAARETQGSWWDDLKDFFVPDEDRNLYGEGLRRGGYLVTVSTTDINHSRVMEILDRDGAINMDERAESWRNEGWKGYAAPKAAIGMAHTTATGQEAMTTGNRDQVIPVVEERLKIGKRETGHGRVRVRSYVVEKPVTEQVTLRDEHLSVERRPVDRPLMPGEKVFNEQTIMAEEKREVPVVTKEARVKEEVTLKKGVEQRTEMVSDKVRKTEVEVEDERDKTVQTGAHRTR